MEGKRKDEVLEPYTVLYLTSDGEGEEGRTVNRRTWDGKGEEGERDLRMKHVEYLREVSQCFFFTFFGLGFRLRNKGGEKENSLSATRFNVRSVELTSSCLSLLFVDATKSHSNESRVAHIFSTAVITLIVPRYPALSMPYPFLSLRTYEPWKKVPLRFSHFLPLS